MGTSEVAALIGALEPLIRGLATVGLPGVLAIVLSGPAFLIAVVVIMSHNSAKRMEKAHERFQENMNTMLEAYRADTQNILREVGDKHAEVAQFYKKNVELVKNYERMTDALQTLVVNNTRAMEHLTTIIETRHQQ